MQIFWNLRLNRLDEPFEPSLMAVPKLILTYVVWHSAERITIFEFSSENEVV